MKSQAISLKIFNDILLRIKTLCCDADRACDKYLIDVKFFYKFLAENTDNFKAYHRAICARDDFIQVTLTSNPNYMIQYSRTIKDSKFSDAYLDEKSLAVMRDSNSTRQQRVLALVESIADKRISFRQFECWTKIVEALHGKISINRDGSVQETLAKIISEKTALPANKRAKKAC